MLFYAMVNAILNEKFSIPRGHGLGIELNKGVDRIYANDGKASLAFLTSVFTKVK